MEPLRLPVRKVVELVLRCGDIDSRYVDSSAMLDGARAHRRIQKTMGPDYQKEVTLSVETTVDDIPVVLQGRADGVIFEAGGGLTVDEIKTTTLPLDRLYEQREMHIGQAKCYAYMLLKKEKATPETITIQLTYFQLDTEELQRHHFRFTAEEIDAFFVDLMERYGVWLRFERDWKALRGASIKETVFPFAAYRRGQRELAVAAYRTIERRKKLYAQAPTGIGKTLSTLFPSVKAMGEGLGDKLFYLTAKTVTRAVAEDSMGLLAEKGLRFKSVTLRAKDKICFCTETICNPDSCDYARGHYDRVNDALLNVLEESDRMTPAVVEEYAEKHRVCPYELSLDIALWADLVICDYNYVFDPTVYLRRFFSDVHEDYVFLVDEAHNLVDRVRDMYTASLSKSSFYLLKRELKDKNAPAKRLRKAMGSINQYLLDVRKECGEETSRVEEEADMVFHALVSGFTTAAEEWLAAEQHSAHTLHNDILTLYFEALNYLGISELYNERYTTITEITGSNVEVTLFCLDPSEIIGKKLAMARASVLFSATLTPLPYYRDILGGGEEDGLIALPSPFDQDRLLLVAHGGISTKYADRPASYDPIAEAIYLAVAAKRGNYMVYFPSYDYMRKVYAAFTGRYPQVDTLVQQSGMDEEARAEFLDEFDAANTDTLVGFCVLGGIFSEGIDLKGDRLIGTVIVGVGLPGISLRQDLIRDYFNGVNGAGFDYAYVFPGMNKVLQAAGRVIRSEEDFGVVLLIDSRFHTARYRSLYPAHWSGMRMIRNVSELHGLMGAFPHFAERPMETTIQETSKGG